MDLRGTTDKKEKNRFQGKVDELEHRARIDRAVNDALDKEGQLPLRLLGYSPEKDGTAVVAIGDVENAANLAVVVPGYRGRVERRIGSLIENASSVIREADSLAGEEGAASSVAAVAWIGYRTPDFIHLRSLDAAKEGSEALDRSLLGVYATRTSFAPRPVVTLIGHSYGGLVVALSVKDSPLVDHAVLAGAPGAPLATRPPRAKIFVAAAFRDPIADREWFRSEAGTVIAEPIDMDFEGRVVNHGHNHYFEEGSASLYGMASIVLGRSPRLDDTDHQTVGSRFSSLMTPLTSRIRPSH